MCRIFIVMATILSSTLLCRAVRSADADTPNAPGGQPAAAGRTEQATFGLGCFSCAEAMFEQLRGVKSVDPGYSGGSFKDPTYEQVSSGLSGHAEVVHITYDPKVITYDELLEVFWKMHDPTTLNRQGKNIGSHYRSVVLYHTEEQGKLAKHYKKKLEESRVFAGPIVTEIKPFTAFYPAEKEHLDFYRLNPNDQYCQTVIQPKLVELKKVFAAKLSSAPDATRGSAGESGRREIEFTTDSLDVVKQNVAENKAVLVDVRSQTEWNQGHLAGAVFLPDASIRKDVDPKYLAEKLPKDKTLYTFCVVGMRAKRVGKILEDHGYTVRVLKPGYDDLIKAGFKSGS
jgi:peptide-methionine (S)-S-oxide reductase